MSKNTIKSKNAAKAKKEAEKSREKKFCKFCGERIGSSYAAILSNASKHGGILKRMGILENRGRKCPYCGTCKKD